jgi:hypothetical protein
MQQAATSTEQVLPVPPMPQEPHCVSIINGGTCDQLRAQYQQSLSYRQSVVTHNALVIGRQQAAQEAAAAAQQAAAANNQQVQSLQQQIADLQHQRDQQVQALQKQLSDSQQEQQTQIVEAAKQKSAAHDEGFLHGASYGVGGTLLLFAVVYGIRRLLRRFTVTRREPTAIDEKRRAASA